MIEPTIAAGFAKAYLDLAASRGASRDELLECSGIDPDALLDQDNRVPLNNYVALLKAGKELSGDPALALHFGEEVMITEMSIVGLICEACSSTDEAYQQINRYWRLMLDDETKGSAGIMRFIRKGAQTWVEFTSEIYVDYPDITESAVARIISGFARVFGDRPFMKEVHVTHPAPSYRAEYERICRVPVIFGSDKNAFLMDESFQLLEWPRPNRYVFGILSERAEALLEDLENSKTVRGRVESLLIPILHKGSLNMEQIAKKMGISRQTLYRKLKREGVSFRELLDDLRHQMAVRYLTGKKASVNETAYLVGFSEPGAFSRAFKRWTGSSPGAYQKKAGASRLAQRR